MGDKPLAINIKQLENQYRIEWEPEIISGNSISVMGEDTYHIINVMQRSANDGIYTP